MLLEIVFGSDVVYILCIVCYGSFKKTNGICFYFCGLAVIIVRRRRRNSKNSVVRVGARTLSRAARLMCNSARVTSFEKQVENIN